MRSVYKPWKASQLLVLSSAYWPSAVQLSSSSPSHASSITVAARKTKQRKHKAPPHSHNKCRWLSSHRCKWFSSLRMDNLLLLAMHNLLLSNMPSLPLCNEQPKFYLSKLVILPLTLTLPINSFLGK